MRSTRIATLLMLTLQLAFGTPPTAAHMTIAHEAALPYFVQNWHLL